MLEVGVSRSGRRPRVSPEEPFRSPGSDPGEVLAEWIAGGVRYDRALEPSAEPLPFLEHVDRLLAWQSALDADDLALERSLFAGIAGPARSSADLDAGLGSRVVRTTGASTARTFGAATTDTGLGGLVSDVEGRGMATGAPDLTGGDGLQSWSDLLGGSASGVSGASSGSFPGLDETPGSNDPDENFTFRFDDGAHSIEVQYTWPSVEVP